MKKCPFCAEEIQSKAIKCKHCGEMLNKVEKNKPTTKNKQSIEIEENKQSFFKKHGKTILYIIGTLIIISGLSGAGNGEPNKIFNTITGLSIILACQSHTGLSSRLNGKSRKIKEILPLALLVLLILIFFSIPSELLIENPLIIFPGLIYIGYYFYIVIKNK